jgi:hypothetical protein
MRQPSPQPFRLHVPDETLRDLRQRLSAVRWPDEPPGPAWSTGATLKDLVIYWRDGFDWRAQEAALNAFRQFKAPLGGIDLHFIHEEGKGPNPIPLPVAWLAGLHRRIPENPADAERPGAVRR